MKKIVLKLYEFDELSKDSQERIIEREHWNVMEQCMDAYGIDYKKSMKAFEDMTDTRVYNWEVGYERYDFSYEFKYKDPIYEHPTDYHRDIFPENLYSGFGETEVESRAMLLFDLLEKKILTPDGLNLKEVDRRKEYENEFE